MSFEGFWLTYPRKIGKAPARQKYDQAIKKGFSNEDIIEGARRFRDHVEGNGTEPKYIPHAATWLHQERWADDLSGEQAKGSTDVDRQSPTRMAMAAAVKGVQNDATAMEREETNLDNIFRIHST